MGVRFVRNPRPQDFQSLACPSIVGRFPLSPSAGAKLSQGVLTALLTLDLRSLEGFQAVFCFQGGTRPHESARGGWRFGGGFSL